MQNKSSNYHIQCEIAYLLTSEHQKLGPKTPLSGPTPFIKSIFEKTGLNNLWNQQQPVHSVQLKLIAK
jgi:hypothetical protein